MPRGAGLGGMSVAPYGRSNSVPRLGPHVRKLGGTCRRSYDIQHFWNLGLESYQRTL